MDEQPLMIFMQPTQARTWLATARLKWLVTSTGTNAELVQAWQCYETGEVEWRPIPFEVS